MKLIYLIVNAWGPYPEQIEIDFSVFKQQGLFLVTGSTGAGKTTLFDAISFALYGNVSGNIREKTTLHSDFAKEEEETFVELKFEHRGVFYKIRRSPRFPRQKKNKQGIVFSSEKAVLEEEGVKPIAIVSEVNKRIEAILGITYLQFKQIVMIAQGEFIQLLISSSKDRVDILRNVFQTQKYDYLQKLFTIKVNQLDTQVVQLKNQIEETIIRIKAEKDTELFTILELKQIYHPKLVLLLKDVVKNQQQKCKNYQKKIELSQNQIKILITTISEREGKDKQKRKLKEKKEKLFQTINEQEKILKQSLENLEQIKELKQQIINNQNQIKSLENYLPLFEEYEQVEKEQKRCLKQLKENEKTEIQILETQIEKTQQKEYATEKRIEREKILQQIAEIKLTIEKQKIEETNFRELLKKKEYLKKETIVLNNQQKEYQKLQRSYQKKKKKYEEEEITFKNAAVGLVARYLKEGEACPVCGSLLHPKVAEIAEGTPDEEQIACLKKEYEKEQKKYQQSFEKASVQKGIVDNLEKELQKELKEKIKIDLIKNDLDKQLERLWKQSKIKIETEQKKIIQLDKELELAQDLIQNLEEIEKQLIKLEEEKQKNQIEKAEIKQRYNILLGTIKKIKTELPKELKEKKEIEKLLKTKRKETEEKQQIQEQIGEDYQKAENQFKISSALYKSVCKELLNLEKQQTKETDLKEKRQELILQEKRREELLYLWEEELAQQKINQEALTIIEEKINQIQVLEQQYGMLKELEQIIRGNNNKRAPLEHYVLSVYFEDILEMANIRLQKITQGRYQLYKVEKVTDARTKDFLNLEVLDEYTGKKRSVKTLSGGEMFKAALSLALGLSDMVQSYAGGIQIDTLFLDEGFGTLDKESLDQALDTLMTLTESNHMIGIISHVEELKERINQQIVVEKTILGSKVKIIKF